MRAFETVRTVYLLLYALVWAVAVLAIAGTVFAVFTDRTEDIPLMTVIGSVAALVVSALVMSWLLLLTICAIDSRNLLADILQHQIEVAQSNRRPSRPTGDRFERPI